jgi:hypothetical protein
VHRETGRFPAVVVAEPVIYHIDSKPPQSVQCPLESELKEADAIPFRSPATCHRLAPAFNKFQAIGGAVVDMDSMRGVFIGELDLLRRDR